MWLPSDLPESVQLVFIYGTKRERWSALSEFLLDSVETDRPAILVVDGRVARDLEVVLRQLGYSAGERVRMLSSEDLAGREGFEPETLVSAIDRERTTFDRGAGPVDIFVDMSLFVSLLQRTERMNTLHALLRDYAAANAGVVVQGYYYDYLPQELTIGHFAERALFVLSESIRRGLFPELPRALDRDRADVLDLAVEQLIVRSLRSLRGSLVPSGQQSGGGEVTDGVSPRFVHHSAEGILLLDPAFAVFYAGPPVRAIFGDVEGDFRGSSIAELLPEEAVHLLTSQLSVLMLRPGPGTTVELPLLDGDGRKRIYRCAVKALNGPAGTFGFLCSFRDSEQEDATVATAVRSRSLRAEAPRARTQSPAARLQRSENREMPFAPGNGVTRREYQIIGLLMNGLQNKEIAEELGLAQVTVKKHLSNIYHKLNIKNRFELLRMTRWS
ncbi:LuxR C-terminal-related transcriptional regulator [Salinispira pacifica]